MIAPLHVLGAGMATAVGLSAAASCAAIRCGINNFNETRFMGKSGEWIVGSQVPLEKPWRGLSKLAKMAASAVRECLDGIPQSGRGEDAVPLVLCIAEEDRPGRLAGLGGPLIFDIEKELGIKFHAESSVVAQGRVGGAIGLLRAQKLIHERGHAFVILVGVDSYLTAPTVAAYEERNRLLTPANSNGFIPGEAAAAIIVGGAATEHVAPLSCVGFGFARETATLDSEKPLRADGIVEAIRVALDSAGIGMGQVNYRISDLSGEQYRFKEAALAVSRILRERKVRFGIWHPADCVGEVGAAALLVMLGVLFYGARKSYLPGPTFLGHLSNDDDKRAALILAATRGA